MPAALTLNGGFTTAPVSSWGGRIKTKLSDTLYVQAGAYEVNPTLVKPRSSRAMASS